MDYYAELELTPDATPEDIKRQYRKLALQYHPDRNPGKETECSARFQAIGQAHEALLDPEQRRKYDLSRQRGNLHASYPRQTNTSRRRDPFPPAASFEPPPKRNDPRFQAHRSDTNRYSGAPPTANGSAPGSGASRYTRFPNPPHPNTANTSSKQDAKARANVFNAWQEMHHASKGQAQPNNYRPGHPPPPPPRRPGAPPDLPPRDDMPTTGAFGRERPVSGERPDPGSRGRPGYRVPPSFYGSHSPRDGPASAGANTAAESINATSTGTHNPNYMAPPFYKPNAYTSPQQDGFDVNRNRQRPHYPYRSRSGDDIPFTEGANRHSTPYTNHVHERTDVGGESLRRSASTKDASKWAQEAARQKQEEMRQRRPQSMGRTSDGKQTGSRPPSIYHNGVEVEEDDSMDGDANENPSVNGSRAPSPPRAQPQQPPSAYAPPPPQQQQQQQTTQEQSPPPDDMDVDPPPATGLDNMQDMSQDLPNPSAKAQTSQQPNGNTEPLNNMSQMASELPQTNSNSNVHENLSHRPSNPSLPNPPKAPEPPEPLTSQSWSSYLAQFSTYLSLWNEFNGAIISHFQDSALRADDRMKGPRGGMVEGWLGAVGATEELGDWRNYCRGLREDEKVRCAWNLACDRHTEAVEKHGRARDKVLRGALGA